MQIPRLHRRLIVLLGGFLIFVGLSGLGDGSDTVISTPEPVVATFKTDPQGTIDPDAKELTSESATSETVDKVKAGDSLASIFSRNGFSAKDLHTISQTNAGKQLKDIFPGHRLSFLHNEGQLKTLTYETDRLTSYVFQRTDTGFSGEKIEFQPEKVVTYTIPPSTAVCFLQANGQDCLTT